MPLSSQPKLVLIYLPRRDGRLSWPWVAGWLHTEINVRHQEMNPDTFAHLSTNWARRRLTSLIEANMLTTTPDHHHRGSTSVNNRFERENITVLLDFVNIEMTNIVIKTMLEMIRFQTNIEFMVPYSQWYLFNAIPDTNYNVNPTNTNCNSKGNLNPTIPNIRYHCEYGTQNSMLTKVTGADSSFDISHVGIYGSTDYQDSQL